MNLTDEHTLALIAWADEGDRKDGTTAWGPTFTGAMNAAQAVRDRLGTIPTFKALRIEVKKELSECVISELADQGDLDLRTKHAWQLLMEHVNKRNQHRRNQENAMCDPDIRQKEDESLVAQMAAILLTPFQLPDGDPDYKRDDCITEAVLIAKRILAEARK